MAVKQIPSDQIEIGMYISSLDRPWLETPFMFQGFMVRGQQEIDDLKQHTKYVYILVADEEIEIEKPAFQPQKSTQASQINSTTYRDTITAEDEIRKIQVSHEKFAHTLAEIEELIKTDGVIKLELIEQPVKIMVHSVTKNPDAYLWLTRLKKFDSFMYKDSLTAAVLGAALGRQLGLPEDELHKLAEGCLLMDIGKMSIPNELLQKSERLTAEEWELMKSHAQLGVDILQQSPGCKPDVLDIVRSHHERIDGSGYPDGLQGSQIPFYAQIAGIVDQYVAVTNPRPYAETLSHSKAQEMLFNQKGRFFDELLVDYFIQTLSTYPTGSLVELSNGEVGIVKAQKPGMSLRPDIILLLDNNKKAYGSYTIVNLDNYRTDELPVIISKTLADGDYGIRIEELSL